MIEVVVLLGAPGSGKSAVGRCLAELGLRWREWELEILSRWGSREEFVAVKDVAVPVLHRSIRDWIDSPGPTAVLETTGLSDRPLVEALRASGEAMFVRLDVPKIVALDRIATRQRGEHLSDEARHNERVWDAFHEHVVPNTPVDLVIDTTIESVQSTAQRISGSLPENEVTGPR